MTPGQPLPLCSGATMAADPTPKSQDDETDFDGCARECRRAGTHTLTWGRCGHATDPRLPVTKDDLRGLLIAAGLVSHTKTMYDGYQSVVVHSDEEAADLALAVFRQWMFGRPEEVAAREAEALKRPKDDPAEIRARIVAMCEESAPGEHERQVRERVAIENGQGWTKDLPDERLAMVRMACGHAKLVIRNFPRLAGLTGLCPACRTGTKIVREITRGEA